MALQTADNRIVIRDETPADIETIDAITRMAFAEKAFSRQTEHFVIRDLRTAGALTLSRVAEEDGEVVGHVAFSPVSISDGSADWYGLGPVAVRPDRQRQGLGSTLIRDGLDRLRGLGAQGCVLLGDPAFYRHFGFANRPELILEGVPQEYFMALGFREDRPHGTVAFHPAFLAQS